MKANIITSELQKSLTTFLETYGETALLTALSNYKNQHENYYFHNNTYTKIIPISSINYVEIYNHDIHIHTSDGNYKKYGTLKSEYEILKKLGFIKCSQSHIIPISKISEIRKSSVLLSTGLELQLSRNCSKAVKNAYFDFYALHK